MIDVRGTSSRIPITITPVIVTRRHIPVISTGGHGEKTSTDHFTSCWVEFISVSLPNPMNIQVRKVEPSNNQEMIIFSLI
jgi:hypothetical protein